MHSHGKCTYVVKERVIITFFIVVHNYVAKSHSTAMAIEIKRHSHHTDGAASDQPLLACSVGYNMTVILMHRMRRNCYTRDRHQK